MFPGTYLQQQPLEVLERQFFFLPVSDLVSLLQNASQVGDEEMVALIFRLLRNRRLEQFSPEEMMNLVLEAERRRNQPLIKKINQFFDDRTFQDFISPELERYFQPFFHPPPSDRVLLPMFYPLLYDPSFLEVYRTQFGKEEVYLGILHFFGKDRPAKESKFPFDVLEEHLFLFLSPEPPSRETIDWEHRHRAVISLLFLLQEEEDRLEIDEASITLYGVIPFYNEPEGKEMVFKVYNRKKHQKGVLRYIPLRALLNVGLFLPYFESFEGLIEGVDDIDLDYLLIEEEF